MLLKTPKKSAPKLKRPRQQLLPQPHPKKLTPSVWQNFKPPLRPGKLLKKRNGSRAKASHLKLAGAGSNRRRLKTT